MSKSNLFIFRFIIKCVLTHSLGPDITGLPLRDHYNYGQSRNWVHKGEVRSLTISLTIVTLTLNTTQTILQNTVSIQFL